MFVLTWGWDACKVVALKCRLLSREKHSPGAWKVKYRPILFSKRTDTL